MPSVKIKDNEPFDIAMRRFKRACEKAGIMSKLRQLEYYEKPTAKRKRKQAAASKRNFKRQFKDREMFTGPAKTTRGTSEKKKSPYYRREE